MICRDKDFKYVLRYLRVDLEKYIEVQNHHIEVQNHLNTTQ